MSSHPTSATTRTGRRPGESGTREAILASARHHFAEHGYARSTLRGIAADAGVDQKLIAHFYGSKQQLFLAAVGLPLNPAEILPDVLAERDVAVVTERIARLVTDILERPELVGRLAAVIRAAATEPEVAGLLRQFFPGALLDAVGGHLGPGDPGLRLNLFGSQIVGLVMVREVLAVEPLASIPARVAAEAVAPALAHYLIGELNDGVPDP